MANERRDFLLAFLIGAVVGVGATVLLSPPARKQRSTRPLEHAMKRFRKRGRKLRRRIPGRH